MTVGSNTHFDHCQWSQGPSLTEAHAAVLQEVAEMIEHGLLVLTADPAEVAQEPAAVRHHLRKGDFLKAEGHSFSENRND